MRTAYKCRVYPTPEQAAVFNRTFGCVRLVWNKTLADRRTAFAKRARYPRFKTRNGKQAAHYTRSAFRIKNGDLFMAKTAGPLAVAWSWPGVDLATLDPTMVIIFREPDGRWYATLAVDTDPPAPLPTTGHDIGIDLGITDFAVTSDGDQIVNPRHLERRARNLARYQRRLARCQKGSANRRKAKTRVAVAHRKVRNARRDFLHKTSTALIRAADTIAIEGLAVANMLRNRNPSRSISDAGWAEFRFRLAYKAARHGRHLIVIDRWYPSSKACSACGHLLPKLDLSTRAWTCPACRTRHDRDLNAAKNILAAERAVAGHQPGDACGADVRQQGPALLRSAVKQEPHTARRPA